MGFPRGDEPTERRQRDIPRQDIASLAQTAHTYERSGSAEMRASVVLVELCYTGIPDAFVELLDPWGAGPLRIRGCATAGYRSQRTVYSVVSPPQ